MLSQYKKSTEKYVDHFLRFIPYVNPNTLTLLGGVISVLFFTAVMYKLYVLAIILFLGNFLDFLDGAVARKYHLQSTFGAFLDSTVDRFSDFLIIAALGFGNIVKWEIVLPLLLFTFLISYVRSRGELASGGKVTMNIGLIERTERLVFLFAGLLLFTIFPNIIVIHVNLAELVCLLLLVLSIYTFSQRIVFAYKTLT
jgi:archaetidylinositol phosphate synthase